MKAWQVEAWGEPSSLKVGEVELPAVGPGQVRIRHHAAGLNFFDLLQVRGQYQIKPPFPFTPGAECAGVIEALGEGVTGWKVGDRVMALCLQNGFAELSNVPVTHVFALPSDWSFAEGAAYPIIYHTGWYALHRRARLQAGETLLVHAGASGVGMAAIQLGKAMGARVIATASTEAKRDFAKRVGADEVIDYTEATWPDEVKTLTKGRGANVVYDPVGGDAFDLSTKCIASEGRLLVIGFASGRIPSIAANRILIKNFDVIGAVWGAYALPRPTYLAEAQQAISTLHPRPHVLHQYAFAELVSALEDLDHRRVIGKAVLLHP
ncbi:MAG: NADPH:quinone oxidoreductase family protein [Bryobacteraceae bacterium]|nr:NADPH:quinone oxidoreductase family protein [Bryobacteraceae bacterium]